MELPQMNFDATNSLSSVITTKAGKGYYSFSNSDGKCWVMPIKHMLTAMHLYQPSGIKGKAMKTFFPYIHWIPLVRNIVQANKIDGTLRNDLHQLLCKIFNVADFEYSLFGGTPSVHQKIVLQIYRGKKILGYCKVSKTQEVFSLFEREAKMLEQFHQKGVSNIPKSLFCGKMEDGLGVFIQTTIKTNHSKNIHNWTALHNAFLEDFYKKTLQKIKFEESDYYATLSSLKEHIDWLPIQIEKDEINNAINKIERLYKGKEVDFCAYHADFTPWNMFVEQGQLFVFDFEYAQRTYPVGLDRYHYFTQVAIFEKHWLPKQIFEYLASNSGKWIDRELYLLYIVDSIARYTIREKGKVEENMEKTFKYWYEILQYLLK